MALTGMLIWWCTGSLVEVIEGTEREQRVWQIKQNLLFQVKGQAKG